MTQEIKIGLKADLAGADREMQGFDKAVDGVAKSVRGVAKEAWSAAKVIGEMEVEYRKVIKARDILTRDLGRPISIPDAQTFHTNFENLRSGRGVGSRRLKAFNGFEEWYNGHTATFSRPVDAERHRRFVLSSGMQGTDDSNAFGAPRDGSGGGGGGGDDDEGGNYGRGIRRAQSAAMGFVKGGLALAGLNSMAGMVKEGVDGATEEAINTDALKRTMGDLGADFEMLRNQARLAANGLGITYVESSRLAGQYAKEAGNLTGADSDKLEGPLKNAYGFSRAYGLDPTQGVQFFASMKRMGVTGGAGDADGHKMAGYIADAIDRGGYGGKAEEYLSAIANFTEQSARSSLSTGNPLLYAGMLSGLTHTGLPGLDPTGAASLLSTADSSFRRGGGMGEASQNFNYMALMRGSPGMDPVAAKALMQGGMFATTRSTFGKGTAMEGMYGGALDDVTNLQKIRDQTKKFYGTGSYGIEAFANNAGLTLAQSKELFNASPLKLQQSQDLDKKIATIDPGTEVRNSIAATKDELTRLGGVLLDPLNHIRDAVVALAERFAPQKDIAADTAYEHNSEATNPEAAAYVNGDPKRGRALGAFFRKDSEGAGKWAIRGMPWMGPDPKVESIQGGVSAPEWKQITAARTAHLAEVNGWISQMSVTDKMLGLKSGSTLKQMYQESHLDPGATGPMTKHGQAQGMAQFMPSTTKDLSARFKKLYGHAPDPRNANDAILLNRLYMGDLMKREKGDYAKALSFYDSGRDTPDNAETRAYVGTIAGHALPDERAGRASATPTQHIHITSDPVILLDRSGNRVAVAELKPTQQPKPAGT